MMIVGTIHSAPALKFDSFDLYLGQTWITNAFTTDSAGNPVQGSDASPIRFTAGGGFRIELATGHNFAPNGMIYRQEYVDLDAYDKTVPTQIETGSAVGNIGVLLSFIIAAPYLFEFTVPEWTRWRFLAGASPTIVLRMPVAAVDGSKAGPPAAYFWRQARYFYPEIFIETDYLFSDLYEIGFVARWMLPIYNIWDDGEQTPFLDESMLNLGLVIRLPLGSDE